MKGLMAFFLGLVAAVGMYLTVTTLTHTTVACPAAPGGLINCGRVLSSSGSTIFSVPLAAYGLVWTVSRSLLRRLSALVAWSLVGFGGVAWGLSHEWMVGSLCLWCTIMQILIVAAVGIQLGLLKARRSINALDRYKQAH
ncbi:MAG: hypothetical protein M0Z36_01480 [Thermaerobacter sp.]|nr:hypothetical protein [Thermaerobacter sp.]